MTYQSNPQRSGFRELGPQELEAISGGQETIGNPFTVTGNRGDTWTVSITPGDLALIGVFNLGGGLSLTGIAQDAPGDGGGFGPDAGAISPEERQQLLNANKDSDQRENIERTLEAVVNALDKKGSDWTFEYNEATGGFVGLSSSGDAKAYTSAQAEQIFNNVTT
jgi:hypothetical protein